MSMALFFALGKHEQSSMQSCHLPSLMVCETLVVTGQAPARAGMPGDKTKATHRVPVLSCLFSTNMKCTLTVPKMRILSNTFSRAQRSNSRVFHGHGTSYRYVVKHTLTDATIESSPFHLRSCMYSRCSRLKSDPFLCSHAG